MSKAGEPARCPALLISAPASGQGKTTLTAALARLHARLGHKVRVFKCGPDFLDPMILERASGAPVYQLDLWIQGENECRRLLWEAAREADLILVEGVMGLFDGSPSAADLAERFNIPVLACIDAAAMAGTFAAVAHGLASFRPGLPFAGVMANRIGSERHAQILRESLGASPATAGMRWFGGLPRSAGFGLPGRHLGLIQAAELADLDARLEEAANALAILTAHAENVALLPPAVEFPTPEPENAPPDLRGLRLGVARDQAFSFIYQANLDCLRQMGAELIFFSPLADKTLPEVDSLYLPGGYPELHLEQLHANKGMLDSIRTHFKAGKPLLAECGGMLYLLESLQTHEGLELPLAGLLPGAASMQKRLVALGSQQVELPEGALRGHTFHHSRLQTALRPLAVGNYPAATGKAGQAGEEVYRLGRLTASYLHLYFPSNLKAVAAMLAPDGLQDKKLKVLHQ